MLAAGHETTATAVAWAFERLLRTPRVLDRLTRSLEEGDEYLDATIKETLRARPVVTDVGRKLTREIELDGYRLPAGTLVMPAIAALHFRADLYPEPDEFRPERFLQAHAGRLYVDPVRRRRAPLHRSIVRAVRDARDHQDDPRAHADAGGRTRDPSGPSCATSPLLRLAVAAWWSSR